VPVALEENGENVVSRGQERSVDADEQQRVHDQP